ncbi:MAG: hypothetical protein QG583_737 [Patescibacteria group bacterium]|nr:hypothetical protein [Patescibacteria group bacterium]
MPTAMTFSKFASVNKEFLFKIRTYFQFGIFNKNSFLKKVKKGQRFYSVNAEAGRNPNSEVEILTFVRSEEYSGPKTEGKDSFICFVEYSTGERSGVKKQLLVEELFTGVNAVFLVDDEEEAFAENSAHGYSRLIKATWQKVWNTY